MSTYYALRYKVLLKGITPPQNQSTGPHVTVEEEIKMLERAHIFYMEDGNEIYCGGLLKILETS